MTGKSVSNETIDRILSVTQSMSNTELEDLINGTTANGKRKLTNVEIPVLSREELQRIREETIADLIREQEESEETVGFELIEPLIEKPDIEIQAEETNVIEEHAEQKHLNKREIIRLRRKVMEASIARHVSKLKVTKEIKNLLSN